jgi:hypothetical protein
VYRIFVLENSSLSRKEMIDMYADNKEEFDRVWQKDSSDYLYDSKGDLYYPISTDDHDVSLHEEFVN